MSEVASDAPVVLVVDDEPNVRLFLQTVLDDFRLVPIVVGACPAREVEAVLDALWGGDETLIVVSSDLSHFHTYDEAREIDARTTARIEARETALHGEYGHLRPVGRRRRKRQGIAGAHLGLLFGQVDYRSAYYQGGAERVRELYRAPFVLVGDPGARA